MWEAEIRPLLEANPQLNAVTVLEELQRRHPDAYEGGLLRTLQRRVRLWRECTVFRFDGGNSIDHESVVLQTLRLQLGSNGYVVAAAVHGRTAIALPEVNGRISSLVILHIMLPVLDGIETCFEIPQDECRRRDKRLS